MFEHESVLLNKLKVLDMSISYSLLEIDITKGLMVRARKHGYGYRFENGLGPRIWDMTFMKKNKNTNMARTQKIYINKISKKY